MSLLPEEIKQKIPKLYEAEGKGAEALIWVHWYHPFTNWHWYLIEFDGEDLCFALVDGFELEFGYFLLSELEDICVCGAHVERDRDWQPKLVGEVHSQLTTARRRGA